MCWGLERDPLSGRWWGAANRAQAAARTSAKQHERPRAHNGLRVPEMAEVSGEGDILHMVPLTFKDGVDWRAHLDTDVRPGAAARLARASRNTLV